MRKVYEKRRVGQEKVIGYVHADSLYEAQMKIKTKIAFIDLKEISKKEYYKRKNRAWAKYKLFGDG